MRKLRETIGWAALALAAGMAVVTLHAAPVSGNWATGPSLASVAVSFDDHLTVFYGASLTDTESVAVAGVNYALQFDNGLNLLVANAANQVVKLSEAAPHGSVASLSTAAGPRSITLAGDGTLYVASVGGTIRRYANTLNSYTEFTVKVETSDCIGTALGADQTTLYIVSGGRNVFMLPNAHIASGDQTANTATFTSVKKLGGSGAACAVQLATPERGSSESRHGGMFVADRVDIKRLNAVGLETAAYKGSGSGQNWVDVAIDPRMVYDDVNPQTGVDPNQYIIWGVDAGQRRIARFVTTSTSPQQVVSTGLEIPRGIAINGQLSVAQVVRVLNVPANGAASANFLEGSAYPHSWKAQNETSSPAQLAVMAFEFLSDGTPDVLPDPATGRCAPSLDGDCRFFNDFYAGLPLKTPIAVAYSHGRAVGYRVVRLGAITTTTPPLTGRVSVTYADAHPTGGGPSCGTSGAVATSILRDPYNPTAPSTQYGHDQFEFDNTVSFFDFDDGVNGETVPDMGTDYVVAARTDVLYSARMQKPDPDTITTPQLGASQPITMVITDPAHSCLPVSTIPGGGSLADYLVLTVTRLGSSANVSKGTPVGDSETPGSLGVNGLEPWSFNGTEWRTNLALDHPPFDADTYYAICVVTKAVNNVRLTNDSCAIIKPVEGSGK